MWEKIEDDAGFACAEEAGEDRYGYGRHADDGWDKDDETEEDGQGKGVGEGRGLESAYEPAVSEKVLASVEGDKVDEELEEWAGFGCNLVEVGEPMEGVEQESAPEPEVPEGVPPVSIPVIFFFLWALLMSYTLVLVAPLV